MIKQQIKTLLNGYTNEQQRTLLMELVSEIPVSTGYEHLTKPEYFPIKAMEFKRQLMASYASNVSHEAKAQRAARTISRMQQLGLIYVTGKTRGAMYHLNSSDHLKLNNC